MNSSMRVQQEGDTTTVTFTGAISEDSEFPKMDKVTAQSKVVFNLKDLTSINSMGIRSFMLWTRSFTAQKIEARFCPRIFVDQINMIKGFLPENCLVQSFYVPYYNTKTNAESFVMYEHGKNYSANGGAVKITHPALQGELADFELDVNEARYFAFLDQHGK